MNINRRTVDQCTVVSLYGALDGAAAAEVRNEINEILPLHEYLVIDLSGTTCVSNASLRTMLLIYRQAQALGHTVAVVGLTPEVRNVLNATGFLDFFVVADSVEDGVATVSAMALSAQATQAAQGAQSLSARAEEEGSREHALSGS